MTISATYDRLFNLLSEGTPISTNSKEKIPGAIFFALKGDLFNGNDFAPEALDNGCSCAVVDDPKYAGQDRYILVHDVLDTLQHLGKKKREQLHIPVIGITGSNGKTTTKELCHAVLSTNKQTHATKGNLNNHIGVPLTLLAASSKTEIAIIEMGANHIQEIERLCHMAKPEFGIISNIGKAHLEGFGSFQNIIQAKTELYNYIERAHGKLFVNGDDDLLMSLSEKHNRILYGSLPTHHCSGTMTCSYPFVAINISVNHDIGVTKKGSNFHIASRLAGTYNFANIMAAVTVGLYWGIDVELIKTAIASYLPQNNRSQLHNTQHNTVLIDAYNANPTSMEAAIANFETYNTKRYTIVMLGDMLELGDFAEKEHRRIYELVLEKGFDLHIFVGAEFMKVVRAGPKTLVFPDTDHAAQWLEAHPKYDHVILLKGSRGIKMEKLIKYL